MPSLALAGLSVTQGNNHDTIIVTQTPARQPDRGPFLTTIDELAARLPDRTRMSQWRANVQRQRQRFTLAPPNA